MIHIHVVTEGPTEKNFVDDLLTPHFAPKKIFFDAHSVTTRRDRRRNKVYRGGLDNIEHLLKDIRLWLMESKSQANTWVTTMVDLYAFPITDRIPWSKEIEKLPTGVQKATFIETQLTEIFKDHRRFIPYIQLHEFEALLLSNTQAIHNAFADQYSAATLNRLNLDIGNVLPEDVNDGRHTAPSKRIIKHYPEYEDNKSIWSSLIAQEMGIEPMKLKCPHFNKWLEKIESLNLMIAEK